VAVEKISTSAIDWLGHATTDRLMQSYVHSQGPDHTINLFQERYIDVMKGKADVMYAMDFSYVVCFLSNPLPVRAVADDRQTAEILVNFMQSNNFSRTKSKKQIENGFDFINCKSLCYRWLCAFGAVAKLSTHAR
jgi:hypothetical protein